MLESLLALAMVPQNDLDCFQQAIEPPWGREDKDEELRELFTRLRSGSSLPLQ